MFHIESLELVHWDYWQRFTLPLNAQIITIVGPNGSGKTTLLDALRTLFALKCSGKRDYKRYVRRSDQPFAWVRAVVDNRRHDHHPHPFFPCLKDDVTLACRVRRQGGEWPREYLIEDGDVPIEQLESSEHWVGVREYQTRLAGAGLTPAITKVLALEQGDTDKLCEYSPKALLDLVFDVFGDKEILDHYIQAKIEQREAQRELETLELDLSKLQNQVETKISEANRYLEWRALQTEREKLVAEIIPRLELAETLESISGGRNRLIGARRQLRERKAQHQTLEQGLAEHQQRLTAAQAAEQRAEQHAHDCQSQLRDAFEESHRVKNLLEEERRLIELAEAKPDAVEAAGRLATHEQALLVVQNEGNEKTRRRAEVRAQIAALKSGALPREPAIFAFRAALDEASIRHIMLNEIVEVTDPYWQAAVEAILRPYRHVVLLENEHERARAWRLGEQMNYRHFVVAGRGTPPKPLPGSLLEVVRFTALTPNWLPELLNRIARVEDANAGAQLARDQDWVTRAGYHKERRGARYVGVAAHDYHFGEAGRRARLERLMAEQADLERELEKLARESSALRQAIAQNKALLMGASAAQLLAARQEEFRGARERLPELERRSQQAADAVTDGEAGRRAAIEARHKIELDMTQIETRLQHIFEALAEEEQSYQAQRREQVKRIQLLRQQRRSMPRHWYAAADLRRPSERYGKAVDAKRALEDIERRLEQESWITDENVLLMRDKLTQDLAARQREVETRRIEYERARRLTDEARGAYINKLRATVRRYARNVRSLGELSGIGVECEMPHLENDDLVLAQAGLSVNFNFDSKGMVGLNDGEASGGQQVMKSLILLIGLMMDEERPGGFVFIDEPFAHLDIFNIDKVGAFLQATNTQYLITTPNTHNINVFSPSDMTLVTRKKQPGEPWAQPVAVARKQKLADHA